LLHLLRAKSPVEQPGNRTPRSVQEGADR
jgi:hypothetical protein